MADDAGRHTPEVTGSTVAATLSSGRVLRPTKVTRAMARAHPRTLFVYGDNMERWGLKGQAASLRGEPNAIGVPTKWRPSRDEEAYFTDDAIKDPRVRMDISKAFEAMRSALKAGMDVAIPARGIGSGLAELPTRAPRLFARLQLSIAALDKEPCQSPTASRRGPG